jgi:hypothetical protein
VDTYTDLFVGVPPKADDQYVFQFKTDGMRADAVRVYVNGRTYTAHRVGDVYTAPIRIHFASLHSPIVLTTIEWSHGLEAPTGKLLEVQIS